MIDPADLPHLRFPHYWSTYCVHNLHAECRLTCKTCEAPCLCPCHQASPNTTRK